MNDEIPPRRGSLETARSPRPRPSKTPSLTSIWTSSKSALTRRLSNFTNSHRLSQTRTLGSIATSSGPGAVGSKSQVYQFHQGGPMSHSQNHIDCAYHGLQNRADGTSGGPAAHPLKVKLSSGGSYRRLSDQPFADHPEEEHIEHLRPHLFIRTGSHSSPILKGPHPEHQHTSNFGPNHRPDRLSLFDSHESTRGCVTETASPAFAKVQHPGAQREAVSPDQKVWLCSRPPSMSISPLDLDAPPVIGLSRSHSEVVLPISPETPSVLGDARRGSFPSLTRNRPVVVRAMSTGRLAREFDEDGRIICLSAHSGRVLQKKPNPPSSWTFSDSPISVRGRPYEQSPISARSFESPRSPHVHLTDRRSLDTWTEEPKGIPQAVYPGLPSIHGQSRGQIEVKAKGSWDTFKGWMGNGARI